MNCEIIDYVKAETDQVLVPYFARMDIGVMPLQDNEWNRGKCALKALQYMASGAATVLSAVGENTIVAKHGETGMLCSTTEEWIDALRLLIQNPELRGALGAAGRERVRENYSFEQRTPEIITILQKTARF